MARHAASSGSTPHPLVVAALAQRAAEGGGHRHRPGNEGPLGWPGPPAGDERIGWPGALPSSDGGNSEA